MSAEFTRRVRNGLRKACDSVLSSNRLHPRTRSLVYEANRWLARMPENAVVIVFTPRELTLLRAALGNTVHDPAWFDEWVSKRDRKAFASMTEKVGTGYSTSGKEDEGLATDFPRTRAHLRRVRMRLEMEDRKMGEKR